MVISEQIDDPGGDPGGGGGGIPPDHPWHGHNINPKDFVQVHPDDAGTLVYVYKEGELVGDGGRLLRKPEYLDKMGIVDVDVSAEKRVRNVRDEFLRLRDKHSLEYAIWWLFNSDKVKYILDNKPYPKKEEDPDGSRPEPGRPPPPPAPDAPGRPTPPGPTQEQVGGDPDDPPAGDPDDFWDSVMRVPKEAWDDYGNLRGLFRLMAKIPVHIPGTPIPPISAEDVINYSDPVLRKIFLTVQKAVTPEELSLIHI